MASPRTPNNVLGRRPRSSSPPPIRPFARRRLLGPRFQFAELHPQDEPAEEKQQPQTPLMEELKCSICHELLTRTLSCLDGHNVCGDCYERLEVPKKCPVCRHAGGFSPNAFVDRLVRSHFQAELTEMQRQKIDAIDNIPDLLRFFNASFEPIVENATLSYSVLKAMVNIRMRGQIINTDNMKQELGHPLNLNVTIIKSDRRNKWWMYVARSAAIYSNRDMFSVFEMSDNLYIVGSS